MLEMKHLASETLAAEIDATHILQLKRDLYKVVPKSNSDYYCFK